MKKVMGVIGYPIKHSLSPQMHEAAYRTLQLNMAYHAFEVPPNQLKYAIDGVRGLGLLGVNVTIPHKVSVLAYLDEVDELAKEIGAVNTIVNDNGYLKGYNTDGEGYLKSLFHFIKKDFHDKRVLIIGAGGAARAVAITIAKYGVREMAIANRSESKGVELATSCNKYSSTSFLPLDHAAEKLHAYEIIINTTSIGMTPHVENVPLPIENIQRGTYVSDLIYTPLKTKWLIEAEKKGALPLSGLNMFIYQGALAFERWTGEKAPIEEMKRTVLQYLQGGMENNANE